MRHRGLARGAAVEHLVAELVLVVARPLGRDRREHAVDLVAHLRDLVGVEHARAAVRSRRVRAAPTPAGASVGSRTPRFLNSRRITPER